MVGQNEGSHGYNLRRVIRAVGKQDVVPHELQVFYTTYSSKFNKESLDSLMYGMTLEEFLDYKNYIDIQNAFEEAMHKDQEKEAARNK